MPKGDKNGFPMDLFVMVSDYQFDKVIWKIYLFSGFFIIINNFLNSLFCFYLKVDQPSAEGCRTGVSFCGLRDRKYPDARSMGFPFDRIGSPEINSLTEFLTPNMRVTPITVRFSDTTRPRRTNNAGSNNSRNPSNTNTGGQFWG